MDCATIRTQPVRDWLRETPWERRKYVQHPFGIERQRPSCAGATSHAKLHPPCGAQQVLWCGQEEQLRRMKKEEKPGNRRGQWPCMGGVE